MLAKAHITIGMAAAFTIMRPDTVAEALPVIAGAAAGCLICDIDCDIAAEKKDSSRWRIAMAALFVCVLIEDYLLKAGMWEGLMSRSKADSVLFGIPGSNQSDVAASNLSGILASFFASAEGIVSRIMPHMWFFGIAGFALACTFAGISKHRGFSHSLLAMVIETICIWMVFPSVCVPFMIAFLTHVALDIMNKKPVYVMYPSKKGWCLGWFYANKTADKIFTAAGTAWLIAILIICLRR